MPDTFSGWVGVVQLGANVIALIGAAAVWRLYVKNLKAQIGVKEATITSVEATRDFWKDKAGALESRSPEVVERILTERIGTREAEIARLDKDREENQESLRLLTEEKVGLERTLESARGFAAMLEMEGDVADDEFLGTEIEVVKIGDVGVDSGQLLITDPCYIDSEWQQHPMEDIRIYRDTKTARTVQYGKDFANYEQEVDGFGVTMNELLASGRFVAVPSEATAPYRYSYAGACDATLAEGFGELAYRMGHSGAGVAFSTAFGDGEYPIYGEKRGGRIVRVYVNVA